MQLPALPSGHITQSVRTMYVDPGSAGLLIQGFFAGVATAVAMVVRWRHCISARLRRKPRDAADD